MAALGLTLATALLLGAFPEQRAPWVLLPAFGPGGCGRYAEVAAQLEDTVSIVTTRTSTAPRPLAETRARLGATLAVEVHATDVGGFVVKVHGEGLAREGRGSHPSTALALAWPARAADGPLPLLAPPVLAPNRAALAAACRGDASAAQAQAGSALGLLLPRLLSFPKARSSGPVFEQWASARAALARGNVGSGLLRMKRVLTALERGEWAPTWRRFPRTATAAASALTLREGVLFAFEGGVLSRIDRETGQDRWRSFVGRAEPVPVLPAGGPVLLVRAPATTGVGSGSAKPSELIALDLETGQALWRAPLEGAHPEIVAQGRSLFVAGRYEVVALDRASGRRRWTTSLDRPLTAGPVDVRGGLAVPGETAVHLLEPSTGRNWKDVPLTDETSAPLQATTNGYMWALVGSDEVLQLDALRGRARVRMTALPGATWPPILIGERLVVLTRAKGRGTLRWLDPIAPGGRRAQVPAELPVLARVDRAGVLHLDRSRRRLVGRDAIGAQTFRLALPGVGRALAASGARAVVALRDRVLVVDVDRARRLHELRFEDDVGGVVLGEAGGAARLDTGVIYGWPGPGDPRRQVWLQTVRRELAEAALSVGRLSEARRAAEAALARQPDDLRARLAVAQAARRPHEALQDWVSLARVLPRSSPPLERAKKALEALGITVEPETELVPAPDDDPPTPSVDDPAAKDEASTERALAEPTREERLGFRPEHALAIASLSVLAGEQQAVGLREGQVRWRYRARGETVLRLEADGTEALLWTDRALHRVRAETGRRKGRVRLPGPASHIARPESAVVAIAHDRGELWAVDVRRPRLVVRAKLAGVTGLDVVGDRVRVTLLGGERLLIDPSRAFGAL